MNDSHSSYPISISHKYSLGRPKHIILHNIQQNKSQSTFKAKNLCDLCKGLEKSTQMLTNGCDYEMAWKQSENISKSQTCNLSVWYTAGAICCKIE